MELTRKHKQNQVEKNDRKKVPKEGIYKKDMDELQESISNRGTSAQEWKTTQRSMDAMKINTVVFNSGDTSNFGMEGDDFILTKEKSNKIFHVPTGTTAPASVKNSTIE